MFSLILAILGLAILIFLHELGHMLVARWCGIKVEVFSIGFGRPIASFERGGVRYQIGIFPFGGFVRMAENETEPGAKDGMLDADPWRRIVVAAAGPFANILTALVLFTVIFLAGGVDRPFSIFSQIVGNIDAQSPLVGKTLAVGDHVLSINDRTYRGGAPQLRGYELDSGATIMGLKATWGVSHQRPIQIELPGPIASPTLWAPAQFLKIRSNASGDPFIEGAPLLGAGAQAGDRLVWLDGQPLFSPTQVNTLLNDRRLLLTVRRNGKLMLVRSPRYRIAQLAVDPATDEWRDWIHEAGIPSKHIPAWVLPVGLSPGLVVTKLLIQDAEWLSGTVVVSYSGNRPSFIAEQQLQVGDHIVAVDGRPVDDATALVRAVQTHSSHVIVYRDAQGDAPNVTQARELFWSQMAPERLNLLVDGFMRSDPLLQAGQLVMLRSFEARPITDFSLSPAAADNLEIKIAAMRAAALAESWPQRQQSIDELTAKLQQNLLGLDGGFADQRVRWNPNPVTKTWDAFSQTVQGIVALITAKASVSQVSGPIGIVGVLKSGLAASATIGLELLSYISIGLAVFNLLPVPVLDGGTIVIAAIEWISGRKIPEKWLNAAVIVFVILLLSLLLFTGISDIYNLSARRAITLDGTSF